MRIAVLNSTMAHAPCQWVGPPEEPASMGASPIEGWSREVAESYAAAHPGNVVYLVRGQRQLQVRRWYPERDTKWTRVSSALKEF